MGFSMGWMSIADWEDWVNEASAFVVFESTGSAAAMRAAGVARRGLPGRGLVASWSWAWLAGARRPVDYGSFFSRKLNIYIKSS